ncbi:MAG: hypothetical protein L6Q92_13900 [Phycisphaerae bacterium]|nr:hypothetical protein [Phycisphaerae bacterium]
MKAKCAMAVALAAMVATGVGCLGRIVGEGAGVMLGARGKVIDVKRPPRLSNYKGIRIESIAVSPGLVAPANLAGLIRSQFSQAATKMGLTASGTPAFSLRGEIVHYESGGAVDTAIGPLEEVIVRTKLMDSTGNVLGEANLVGRSKATTSSGAENLAEGAGKALRSWLKEAGLRDADDKD